MSQALLKVDDSYYINAVQYCEMMPVFLFIRKHFETFG